MSDDSLTARNRINQRNFRARRQNYIKELEERLRKYESEGVQATIEIQAAARQAHDQNSKLRNLLIQRYGMSDNELTSYLGFSQQSPMPSGQISSNLFASSPYLTNLAPAPAPVPPGSTAPKVPISADHAYSYPTPPQQSDPPRTLTSAHLDPALSLASLHRYPSNHEQRSPLEPTPSRRDSDPSTHLSPNTKPASYTTRPPDSPTDTLSESSNPTTPAEQTQMQIDNKQHHPPIHPAEPTPTQIANTCCNPQPSETSPKANSSEMSYIPRPNDETSCEEAARIIASMRGGGNDAEQDQVMLDLGCSGPTAKCNVKNISIFQLMDRT